MPWRPTRPASGPLCLSLLALSLLSGCGRTAVAVRPEVLPILPPPVWLVPRPEPGCAVVVNGDLTHCLQTLAGWGRQCEGDKASLAAWRTGAEQAARPQETRQERGWWPWTRD